MLASRIHINQEPRPPYNLFDILNFTWNPDKLYSFCPKFFEQVHHHSWRSYNMQLFKIVSQVFHCCFVVLQQGQRRFLCFVMHHEHVIFYMINRPFLWFHQYWIHSSKDPKPHQKHNKSCNFLLIVLDRFDYIQNKHRLDQIMLAIRQRIIDQEQSRWLVHRFTNINLFLRSPLVFLIKNKIIFFREFVTLFWNNYKTIDLTHNIPKQFKRFVPVELDVFRSNNGWRNNIMFKLWSAILLKPPFD